MGYWNYRIVKKTNEYGEYYAIHEAFYNNDGSLWAVTEDGVDIGGENIEDMREAYEMMVEAFDEPVINYEDVPGDDMSDEDYFLLAQEDEDE